MKKSDGDSQRLPGDMEPGSAANQKKALWLNLATLLVFAGMVVVAAFVVPLSFLLDLSAFFVQTESLVRWRRSGPAEKLAVVVVDAVACLMLQALLGGLLGRWFSGVRAHLRLYGSGSVYQQQRLLCEAQLYWTLAATDSGSRGTSSSGEPKGSWFPGFGWFT